MQMNEKTLISDERHLKCDHRHLEFTTFLDSGYMIYYQ